MMSRFLPKQTFLPLAMKPEAWPRTFILLAASLALALSCSPLPDVTFGICGNGIVEKDKGEDCDSGNAHVPSCGYKDDPAIACRFTCDDKTRCQPGLVCGLDHICRQPLGTYTLGRAVSDQDEMIQVGDFDGDGFPDLLKRRFDHVDLWRNDGSGSFTPSASGSARAQIIDPKTWGTFVPIGAAANRPQPIVATVTNYGLDPFDESHVDLYAWGGERQLTPLVVPDLLFPAPTHSHRLLGGTAGDLALVLEPDTGRLVAYLRNGYFSPATDWDSGSAQISEVCKLDLHQQLSKAFRAGPHGVPTFALGQILSGEPIVCLGTYNGLQLDVQTLSTAGLPLDHDRGGAPVLVDVDGNGLLDVLLETWSNHEPAGVLWLKTSQGFLAPLFIPPAAANTLPSFGALDDSCCVDFNGDQREDAYDSTGQFLWLNRTEGVESQFSWAGGFVDIGVNWASFDGNGHMVAGDFNGDHRGDYLFWTRSGFILPCFGDGTVHFACVPTDTQRSIADLISGDINGDGKDDALVVERADGGDRLRVLLGGGVGALQPVSSVAQMIEGSKIIDLTLAPGRNLDAGKQVYVLMQADSGEQAIAIGRADASGILRFGYTTSPAALALADFNDDGKVDLALVEHNAVQVLDGLLPFSISQQRFAIEGNNKLELSFCALGEAGKPALCAGADNGSLAALWSGGKFAARSFPSQLHSRSTEVLDVDGDGRDDFVDFLSDWTLAAKQATQCSIRVLHQSSAGEVGAIDSPTQCPGGGVLVDLPPFDQHLDLAGDINYLQDPASHTFTRAPLGTQLIVKSGPGLAVLNDYVWITTRDFNGDGLPDLLYLHRLDGRSYIAFADVARR
jgi:hypothetical protein